MGLQLKVANAEDGWILMTAQNLRNRWHKRSYEPGDTMYPLRHDLQDRARPLKVSEGWVRCGRCNEIFNALPGLFDLEREPPPRGEAPSPSANGLNGVGGGIGRQRSSPFSCRGGYNSDCAAPGRATIVAPASASVSSTFVAPASAPVP